MRILRFERAWRLALRVPIAAARQVRELGRQLEVILCERAGGPNYQRLSRSSIEGALRRYDALVAERRAARGCLERRILGSKTSAADLEPCLRTWSASEIALDEARLALFTDPARARELLELSFAILESLPTDTEWRPLVADLWARGWAICGIQHRLSGRPKAAEAALAESRSWLERGTGDPLESLASLELEAAILREQRRFREASQVLDRAITTCRGLQEPSALGRLFIERGRLFAAREELQSAAKWLQSGLAQLTSPKDQSEVLAGKLALVGVLLETPGRGGDARFLLETLRPEAQASRASVLRAHFLWLDGCLLVAAGKMGDGAQQFEQAAAGFATASRPVEQLLASLDLAHLLVASGRTVEARDVICTVLPLAQSSALPATALAAMHLLEESRRFDSSTVLALTSSRPLLRSTRQESILQVGFPTAE